MKPPSKLEVNNVAIQQIYNMYSIGRFHVNRRYQRKLVWSLSEKQSLIDSIMLELPLPLFLVADVKRKEGGVLEIIDGLQRMEAIFSFIENKYSNVHGDYFNLKAISETIGLMESGEIEQRTPIMSMEDSQKIAYYYIPLSTFTTNEDTLVEDAFKRINYGGKRLSPQALRQAGTLSQLATLVRELASNFRGDSTSTDNIELSKMAKLSISHGDLQYGIDVKSIFWYQHTILRSGDLRQSEDEQMILDLIIDCLFEGEYQSGKTVRDRFYGFPSKSEDSEKIAKEISLIGWDVFKDRMMQVFSELKDALDEHNLKFIDTININESTSRCPRYYHVAFVAIYHLYYMKNLRIRDTKGVVDAFKSISVPSGGGNWSIQNKKQSISQLKGLIEEYFEGPIDTRDLAKHGYSKELEIIMRNALTEQDLFECKQGILELHDNRSVSDDCIEQVAKTISAMNNKGPGCIGYIAIGIADTPAAAERVSGLDSIQASVYDEFHIVGIEREANILGMTVNQYLDWLIKKLKHPKLEELGYQCLEDTRLIRYKDKIVVLITVRPLTTPVMFDGELYDRHASNTIKIEKSGPKIGQIFARFSND